MARKPNPKLTAAAVEATAEAFLAAFKALPAKVKGRFVELLDDYEDELDWQQYEADKAVNPDDYDRKNSVPWEQVKVEMDAQQMRRQSASIQRKAA